MLTNFQKLALKAIANAGGIQWHDHEPKEKPKFWERGKWVGKQGQILAVSAADGTYGFIGMPTLMALVRAGSLVREEATGVYYPTGK